MSFWLKPLTAAVVALGAVTLVHAVTPTARVDNHQARQAARIDQGVASGELTRREEHRLEHQQQHIANVETRVESDGKVTAKEAVRMEHAQDRASRNIYRKKHNRRD
jgi:uncharacterized membrane protein YhiD involved in acid resistance